MTTSRFTNVWVLHALLSHWRRHPLQLLMLACGLIAATALWSGVQALNAQARSSYDQAAGRFNSLSQTQLISRDATDFSEAYYISLRRAGWKVTPLLEGSLQLPDGPALRIIGLEPLTLTFTTTQSPRGLPGNFDLKRFLTPPGQLLVSQATADQLKQLWQNPDIAELFKSAESSELPHLHVTSALNDKELIADIHLAQQLLALPGKVSRLLLTANPPGPLPDTLAPHLKLITAKDEADLARLTDSFHLNLTALSLLAFVVGLLIVYSSINLAFAQRRPLRQILHSCGVSQRQLLGWLLAELLLLGLLAALPGLISGYLIASLLLPDLAASLRGLYGAQVTDSLTLEPVWWWSGLAMTVGGVLLAAILPLIRLIKPSATQAQDKVKYFPYICSWLSLTGALLWLIALLLMLWGESLMSGFMLLTCLLFGSALLMPACLKRLLTLAESRSQGPVSQWLWADARLQLPGLSLALMALLLALSTSIGVGGMVEGFRKTFSGWLDQRLAAEIYLRADNPQQAQAMEGWLSERDDVEALLPSRRTEISLQGWPVELRGFKPHATYADHWPLLSSLPSPWQQVATQPAVLINEQLARNLNLSPGDSIQLPATEGDQIFIIAAIYSDYGNPKGQLMLSIERMLQHWPDAVAGSYALRAHPQNVEVLMQALTEQFNLDASNLFDQQAVKGFSTQLFERTFAATQALNLFILGVAAIALFSSLLTLSSMRLSQLAPVWACGISRRHLMLYELIKLLSLAMLTALLAIPLGLLLNLCLVKVINVRAFGWKLPWHLFPAQWLWLIGVTLIAAFLAALVPLLRLHFSSPSDLLRSFSHDN
ncbi:ABC transporter permease [Nitrincola iocasae]|uniref:ABC transporter permease n=1 Tax=Nitrincola iocasae TaxID=2614693 RepID=A0A5J6LGL7_9GAMM|nr:FtsX-like permease family protein [Nitrincola iocasae]QEW07341.1 ABC transporter permease [Nitrincola iocasae]